MNAWKSTEPLVLWRRGDPPSPAGRDAALTRRDDLTTCLHPIAIELAVTHPQPCWVGVIVSSSKGSVHRLDHQAVAQVFDVIKRTT